MESASSGIFPYQSSYSRQDRDFDQTNRSSSSEQSLNDSHFRNNKSEDQNLYRIQVEIFGQSYNIIGEEPPERVEVLARYLDQKMSEIALRSKGMSALKIAILAALNIAEEMQKLQERNLEVMKKEEHLILLLDRAFEE